MINKFKDKEFIGIDMEDCEGNIFENNIISENVTMKNSNGNVFNGNKINGKIKIDNSTYLVNGKKFGDKK